MASKKLSQFIGFITSFAVFAAFTLIGLREFLTNLEDNKCKMTFMFEIPEYLRVPLSNKISSRFPRYALYLYGEGRYADVSRELRLSGIPVLFIPGNAGSHKQARSLASVALRKAEHLQYHFNYFCVDFDEDLSGIFGGVLQDQTEFVKISITRILGLYKKAAYPPNSVVLIGHSMGGLIARALFSLPSFDTNLVHTIITLGTPHKHAVVSSDPLLVGFYKTVNRFWQSESSLAENSSSKLRHISMVSVGGGFRDVLVRSSLTSLRGLVHPSLGISVVATSIPKAWVSIDHLCLCWCKQLILITNRAMFDMVDPSSHQITSNVTYRMDVLRHHFVSNYGSKRFGVHNGVESVDATPVIVRKKLWRFKGGSNAKSSRRLYAFPTQGVAYESLLVLTSQNSHQWIFGCPKNSNQSCKRMIDLSNVAQLVPWHSTELRFVQLKLQDFPEFSHFAIYVPKPKVINTLWTEYLAGNDSVVYVNLPWLFTTQLLDIGPDSTFVNLTLKSLSKVWKVYMFKFDAIDCERQSLIVVKVHVPWFNEDSYHSGVDGSFNFTVRLHHPRPRGRQDSVQIHVWLDSKCSYKVTVKQDLYQMLGQLFRFYGVQLPVWAYSLMFLVLAWQLSSISVMSRCSSFFSLITNPPQSLRVLLLLFQTHFVVSQIALAFCVMQGEEGQHDWLPSVHELRTFDWVIPLVIIILSAVIIVIAIFVWIGIFTKFGGSVLSCLPHSLKEQDSGLKLRDIVLAAACSLVSLVYCGVLGVGLAVCLCLWRGWNYAASLKFHQSRSPRDLKRESQLESAGNLSLSISSMLVLVLITNAPTLAVWAKNLKYSYHLSSDHTAFVSAILVFNIIVFRFPDEVPRSAVYLCFLIGVAVPQASLVQLYLIPYAFCFVLSILNLLRLLKYFCAMPREKDE